jgi:ABC-type Fe3+-hydroxamate transport system substrate-binding protein
MKKNPRHNFLLLSLLFFGIFLADCGLLRSAYAVEDKIDPNCARIVSLAPSITTLLVQLNLAQSIVAISKFDSIVPSKGLTVLGGYLDLKLEAVIASKPTIVIGLIEHQEVLQSLNNLGIKTLTLNHNRLNSLLDSIQQLGSTCNQLAESKKLILQFNQAISAPKSGTSNTQTDQTALILIQYANTDLPQSFVLGENSILSDLLRHYNIRPWLKGQSKLYSEIKDMQLLIDPPSFLIIVEMPKAANKNEASFDLLAQINANQLLHQIPLLTLKSKGFAIPGYQFLATLTELSEQLCSLSKIKCSK